MSIPTRRSSLHRHSWFWFLLALAGAQVVGVIALAALVPELRALLTPPIVLVYILIVSVIGAISTWAYVHSLERRLLRPLRQITEVTQAITEGAVSGRIELAGPAFSDAQRVAEAINRLAEKAIRDIAEMKRLERVRSEFIGNVSHELRTPIFSVQGYLETLLDGALDDPAVSRQFLEKAYSNALRLNALLSDLIDISRIESGELRLSFRYFNIGELLRDLVHTMEIRAVQRNVTVEFKESADQEVIVYGDKERLTQVLTNLIDNAIKYNVPEGTVTVSAIPDHGQVHVRIQDTGIGIPPEHQARVFERFYRVDRDRSRAVGGTGLGLAIVKHILEAHQAPARVQSEVGVGTCIEFVLKGNAGV